MAIKKHDFVEIEYTGRLAEDDAVFDTTDEKLAKETGIGQPDSDYSPVIICVGENQVLPGIDREIMGKKEGSYTFQFSPEEAFGKKDARLIQLIPTIKFRKENINPMPGMQVNVDGTMGIVRTVTGGRTLVDFNHPLAGKDVKYDLKINRIVTDQKEQADAYLDITLRLKEKNIKIEGNKATVDTDIELPDEVKSKLEDKMKQIFNFESITFRKKPEKDKKA